MVVTINLATNNDCINLPALMLGIHNDAIDSPQSSASWPDCRLGNNQYSLLFSPVESSVSNNLTTHLVDQSPKTLSFDLTAFPSAEGRQRTAQACEKCRERKTKCSGERPVCQRCTSRGLLCTYSNRVRASRSSRSRRNVALEDVIDLELKHIQPLDPIKLLEDQVMVEQELLLYAPPLKINNNHNKIVKSAIVDDFSKIDFLYPPLGRELHDMPPAITMEHIFSMPPSGYVTGTDQKISPNEMLLCPRFRDSSRSCNRPHKSVDVFKTKSDTRFPIKSACPGVVLSPTHPVCDNDTPNVGFSLCTGTPLALQVPTFNHVLAYETQRLKETLNLDFVPILAGDTSYY